MKYQFIAEYAHEHSVALMCKVLGVSRSGYYGFAKGEVSSRELANQKLLEQIQIVHTTSREIYGSPRVFRKLRANGVSCGRHRVARLMAKAGIVARIRRRFRITTRRRAGARYAPDQLRRSFIAERPHAVWTSDITYIWTAEGWLYLAVVLDLYSRLIVGWATSERIDASLVCRAVNGALVRYRPTMKVILHSDRGSQYTSDVLRVLLATKQHLPLVASHGASCYDNAITESFFHTLKTEWVFFENYQTREDGHRSLFDYIEVFYNRQRLHSSLDYRTPGEVESEFQLKEKA
jgi:transposase InsO family protein